MLKDLKVYYIALMLINLSNEGAEGINRVGEASKNGPEVGEDL